MSNTEDRNDETINLDLDEHTSAEDADMDVNTEANANADDDFDYLKEIEEIEAQEKELEEQRQKKKEELERRREEREKDEKKSAAQRKREMKERKKEAEWLGEPFEDDVEIVPTAKKKKSKKGLVAIVVIVLIALAGGAAFAYKMQADKKELADFSQKVAAFQSEKLDGRDFGSHQSYFTDFMKECQDAIDAGDLKKMEDLDKKWSEVENTYTTVSNGKTSLDAFASGIDQALSTYSITDDYKATYETLKKDVEAAQKDCDYEKVSDFQKQLDALATNLKSDNLKVIQNLKNDISSVSLDKDYVSADDQKKLDAYSTEVEKYIKEENYAQAVTTLNSWKTDVTALKKTIDDKKAAEQAKAESKRAAESKAAESKAAESKKNQTTETKKDSSKKDSSKNNSSSSNSSASSDYVLPGSSSQYLSASDVKNLSSYQLMIARNEIYARHGRKFNDSELQAYFNGKSWYKGTVNPEDFSTSVFNDYEIKNIQLIQSYE